MNTRRKRSTYLRVILGLAVALGAWTLGGNQSAFASPNVATTQSPTGNSVAVTKSITGAFKITMDLADSYKGKVVVIKTSKVVNKKVVSVALGQVKLAAAGKGAIVTSKAISVGCNLIVQSGSKVLFNKKLTSIRIEIVKPLPPTENATPSPTPSPTQSSTPSPSSSPSSTPAPSSTQTSTPAPSVTPPAPVALSPSFGAPIQTPDGFRVEITNYDAAFTWQSSVTNGGSSSILQDGSQWQVVISGLASNVQATATITTTRTGYPGGDATVSGTSLQVGLNPVFDAATTSGLGFVSQILNYDPNYTWTLEIAGSGVGEISGSGLVTVDLMDLGNPAVTSTVTVHTSRPGYRSGVGSVTGTGPLLIVNLFNA